MENVNSLPPNYYNFGALRQRHEDRNNSSLLACITRQTKTTTLALTATKAGDPVTLPWPRCPFRAVPAAAGRGAAAPGGQGRCADPPRLQGALWPGSGTARWWRLGPHGQGWMEERLRSTNPGQPIPVPQQGSEEHRAGTAGISRNPMVADEMYQKLRSSFQ